MLSSSDIVALAATRAGVGRRDESGWREEDDAVMVMAAVAMLSRRGRAVDDTIRGGMQTMQGVVVTMEEDDNCLIAHLVLLVT